MKTMKSMRKHKDIELLTTEVRKELFSIKTKLAYNNKFFSENLLATEMEKHGYS